MKPIPQVSLEQSDRNSFPLTDFQYQSTLEASRAGVKGTRDTHQLRAIWRLSAEFFGAETTRDYIAELVFFILITAISAWPIISSIVAVVRMLRNY